MNWKDYPHLFAKFEMIDREGDVWGVLDYLWQNSTDVTGCQLIARRISDMTDEEIKKLGEFGSSIWDDPSEDLDFYQVVYLLSIGCYPFNQEDFENGEVLDAKEVV